MSKPSNPPDTIGGVEKLVERLRQGAFSTDGTGHYASANLMREAASTIERLSERCEAYKGQVESGAIAIEHRLSAIVELRASLEETLVLAKSAFGDIDSAQERLERAELAIEKSKSFVGAKS